MFRWTASGRAIANGREEGFPKLHFDGSPEARGHGKILGSGMIGEMALAIEMGTDAVDIGKKIYPKNRLWSFRIKRKQLSKVKKSGPVTVRACWEDYPRNACKRW